MTKEDRTHKLVTYNLPRVAKWFKDVVGLKSHNSKGGYTIDDAWLSIEMQFFLHIKIVNFDILLSLTIFACILYLYCMYVCIYMLVYTEYISDD